MIEATVKKRLVEFQLAAEVSDSGFICLLGKNGSGKTCFLRSIAGLLRPDEAKVVIGGVDVTRLPVEKRGVVLVTPSSTLPHLRVDAHLVWGARVRGVRVRQEWLAEVKERLGVGGEGRVGTLSLGNRERVALGTALLSSPRVLLVDEAFANLHDRRDFISSYRALATKSNIDVIFSTQDESELQLAEHGYLISEGKTDRKF